MPPAASAPASLEPTRSLAARIPASLRHRLAVHLAERGETVQDFLLRVVKAELASVVDPD